MMSQEQVRRIIDSKITFWLKMIAIVEAVRTLIESTRLWLLILDAAKEVIHGWF